MYGQLWASSVACQQAAGKQKLHCTAVKKCCWAQGSDTDTAHPKLQSVETPTLSKAGSLD